MNIYDNIYPCISIIMPAYNTERQISKSIESVLSQTYTDWELIIIDDGSTDNTYEMISQFKNIDSRIKLFRTRGNVGAGLARNEGILRAKGRYIAFLDSDDQYLPFKLEKQIEFMKRTDAKISCTYYMVFNENERLLYYHQQISSTISYQQIISANPIGCSTVMIDKLKISDICFPDLKKRQDWALWLNLTRGGTLVYTLEEHLTKYFIRKGSLSRNKVLAAWNNWKILRDYEKLSLTISIRYFLTYAWQALKMRSSFFKVSNDKFENSNPK